MPAFRDVCPMCLREFTNYIDPIASRTFCSVGCQYRSFAEGPLKTPPPDDPPATPGPQTRGR